MRRVATHLARVRNYLNLLVECASFDIERRIIFSRLSPSASYFGGCNGLMLDLIVRDFVRTQASRVACNT